MNSGKINKNWIDLDFSSIDSLQAFVIPYDATTTIYTKLEELSSGLIQRKVEYFTLTSGDVANKGIMLSSNPCDNNIELNFVGGLTQKYERYFILKNINIISWSEEDCEVGLEYIPVEVGDVIRVVYNTYVV